MKNKIDAAARRYRLTEREKEVAAALLAAKNPKQIAGALGISFHTVDFHKRAIYRKMSVQNSIEFFLRVYLRSHVAT